MNISSLTIKLDEEIKERAEKEKQEDKQRWEHYTKTGDAIKHNNMKDWLKSL